jgi:hypothetical protein
MSQIKQTKSARTSQDPRRIREHFLLRQMCVVNDMDHHCILLRDGFHYQTTYGARYYLRIAFSTDVFLASKEWINSSEAWIRIISI